jgi:hypothetical protein
METIAFLGIAQMISDIHTHQTYIEDLLTHREVLAVLIAPNDPGHWISFIPWA